MNAATRHFAEQRARTLEAAKVRFGSDPLSDLRPDGGFIPLSGGMYVPETGQYIPYIRGGARGMSMSRDSLRTLDGFTFPAVYTDLVNSLAAYNRVAVEFLQRLCFRTTLPGVREISPGTMKWERGTEFGRPDRQRAHAYRTRGLPVNKYQLGEGYTRDFLLNARQVEIDAQHTEAMRSDRENLLYEIMAAAFNNVNYTFTDDQVGPVTVVALYNGDTEVPAAFEGRTFTAPHDHYHATAGATLAHADILTMKADLLEHGHDGNRVLYAAADLEDDLRGMEDAGSVPVFFRNINGPDFRGIRLAGGSTETLSAVSTDYIGMIEGFQIRILNWLPSGYLFAYNAYGNNSQLNPFAFREKTNAAQQGLQLINENPSSTYPIVNSFYERWFGVGVINRSNGSVMYVTGGGVYVAPTLPSAT